MATRELKSKEIMLAKKVFDNNLPYANIRLADDMGVENRPWVQPSGSGFIVHIGPKAFKDATASGEDSTFIHELTHVWQGSHGFPLGYVFESMASQGMLGGKAYVYELGTPPGSYPWESYNPEQQAEIVKDWYATGMDPNSPLFKYIKVIRTKPMNKQADYDLIR